MDAMEGPNPGARNFLAPRLWPATVRRCRGAGTELPHLCAIPLFAAAKKVGVSLQLGICLNLFSTLLFSHDCDTLFSKLAV